MFKAHSKNNNSNNNDDDDVNNKRASIISEDDFDGGFRNSFLRRLSKSDRDSDDRLSRRGSTSSMNLIGLKDSFKQSMLNLCHSIQHKVTDKEHKGSITSTDSFSQLPPKASRKSSKKDKDNYDTVSLSGSSSSSSFANTFRKSFMNKFGSHHANKKRTSKEESNSMLSEPALSTSSRLSVSDLDIRDEKHPKLQVSTSNQVSPKSPTSATPALSPPVMREISYPRAVDDEKMQEFTSSKQLTIQKMLDQAIERHQALKELQCKQPSEVNQANVEGQAKVINRLKSQLSQTTLTTPSIMEASLPLSSSGASMKESASAAMAADRRSSCMENSASSLDDKEDSSSSSCGLPLHAHYQQRNCSKLCSKLKNRNAYLNSTLARSHSDSYKQRQEYLGPLKPSVSSDDFSSLTESSSIGKRRQVPLSRSHSKSQGGTSDGNSDADQLHPLAEEHSTSSLDVSNSTNSISGHRNSQQSIMAFENEDDNPEELEKKQWRESQFSKFEEIRNRPAHLAVFLHYLISNSDPAPLLFHLVTENFGQSSHKDIRRWTYELYSTFLHEKAPLKFYVNPAVLEAIQEILSSKSEKEDRLPHLVDQVRSSALGQVKDLFGDFGNKLSLGLGGFYGENELKDVNGQSSEVKFIENSLWRQFVTLSGEDNERSSATCSALLTYLQSINFPLASGHAEKFTPFMHKEKSKFSVFSKPSKKTIAVADHHLQTHQFCSVTYCGVCSALIGGLGVQGYVCLKCELSFHKGCMGKIKDKCKRVDRSKTTPNIIRKKIRGPLLTKQAEDGGPGETSEKKRPDAYNLPRAISLMSLREGDNNSSSKRSSRFFHNKVPDSSKDSASSSSKPLSRDDSLKTTLEQTSLLVGVAAAMVAKFPPPLEALRSGSPEPDDESREFFDPVNKSFPNQHIPALSNNSQVEISSDSDFEVETDVPSLESYIPKDFFKKMKPKEKKRQNIINELFHTERNHVRNMKVMHHVIYLRMSNEFSKDFVNLLFPNLEDLIKVHDALNKEFKRKRNESENFVVENFADILLKHFTGDTSDKFKKVCALFCEKQSQALEKLKVRQKKDQKLAAFLQEAANNPLCRRFELKDLLPTAMQRLTKYPLFISGLLKYTSDADECKKLEVALAGSKSVLEHVDRAVQRHENHLKLVEMQKRLDKRAIENAVTFPLVEYRQLDLTRHALVFDGSLTWRMNRDRLIPLHVVLLEDVLLLLQKQDDRLILKCQSMYITAGKVDTRMTHSPIIKLHNLLIKPVATDPLAFFIVSQFTSFPQIYDLIAPSREEKDKWCKRITEAADAYKTKHPEEFMAPPVRTRQHQSSVPTSPAISGGEPREASAASSSSDASSSVAPLVNDGSSNAAAAAPSTIPESREEEEDGEEESNKMKQQTTTTAATTHQVPQVPQFTFGSQELNDDYHENLDEGEGCEEASDVVKLRKVDRRIEKLMREKRQLVESLRHGGKEREKTQDDNRGQEAVDFITEKLTTPGACIQSLLIELEDVLKLCKDLENDGDTANQWSCFAAPAPSEEEEKNQENPGETTVLPAELLVSQSLSTLPQGDEMRPENDGKIATSCSDSTLSSIPGADATAEQHVGTGGDSSEDLGEERPKKMDDSLLDLHKFNLAKICYRIQTELLDLLESVPSALDENRDATTRVVGTQVADSVEDPAPDQVDPEKGDTFVTLETEETFEAENQEEPDSENRTLISDLDLSECTVPPSPPPLPSSPPPTCVAEDFKEFTECSPGE